jgi:mRNA deadenylase 3'-5' endonuclease subunit Ccr4
LSHFFIQYNYSFISSTYKNDTLGVAIAHPIEKYFVNEIVETKILNYENIILSLKLEVKNFPKNDYKIFSVSTCHCPCKFNNQSSMNDISNFIVETIYNLQMKWKLTEQIFAGDFNMLPDSESYNILSKNFTSAHKEINGFEPPYTNATVTLLDNVASKFIGCIDYIFFNNFKVIKSKVGIKIEDVENNLCPNAVCPSDHVPLVATLIF